MTTITARSNFSPSIASSSRSYVPRNMPNIGGSSRTSSYGTYNSSYVSGAARPARSTSRDTGYVPGSYKPRTSSASKRRSPVRGLSTDRYGTNDRYSSDKYSGTRLTNDFSKLNVKPVSNPRPLPQPSTPPRSSPKRYDRPLKTNNDLSYHVSAKDYTSKLYEDDSVKTYSRKLSRTNSVNQMVSKYETIGIASPGYGGSSTSLKHSKKYGSQNDLYNGTGTRSSVSTPEKTYAKPSVLGGTSSSTVSRERISNSVPLTHDNRSENKTSWDSSSPLPAISTKGVGTAGTSSLLSRSPSIDRGRQDAVDSSESSGTLNKKPPTGARQNSQNSLVNGYTSSNSTNTISRSSPESSSKSGGLVGLKNLGNTCFMNSILQCLSFTTPLRDYCLTEKHDSDINRTSSTMKGALINAFAKLLKSLWKNSDSYVSPADLKKEVARYAPRFTGYSQQDSQELLTYLLEGLHEDVNRVTVKKKRMILDDDDDDGKSPSSKASESWKRYLDFDDSKIVDMFVGQLRSSLQCQECKYTSYTFDPFWNLPLPIKKRGSGMKLEECFELFTKKKKVPTATLR